MFLQRSQKKSWIGTFYTFFLLLCRNMPLLGWMNYEVQIHYKMKIWNKLKLKEPLHCVLAAQYYKKLLPTWYILCTASTIKRGVKSEIERSSVDWQEFWAKRKAVLENVIKLWKYYNKEKIVGKKVDQCRNIKAFQNLLLMSFYQLYQSVQNDKKLLMFWSLNKAAISFIINVQEVLYHKVFIV